MAISGSNLTSGQTTAGVTSVATASISPTSNALVIVSVAGGLNSGTHATVTGASGTWVEIFYEDDAGGPSGNHMISMFRDLSASPGSGALTIDFGSTVENKIFWSVDQFTGTDTSGTHGSGAIVQSVKNFDTAGTQTGDTVTLAALGSANNAAYGYTRVSGTTSGTVTKGSSFTELSNVLAGGSVCEAEWAINQTAVVWTYASFGTGEISVFGAVEIKASTVVTQNYVQAPYSLMPDPAW